MTTPYREAYVEPATEKPRSPVDWPTVAFIWFLACAGIALLALPVFAFYETSHRPKFPATVRSNGCDCTCKVAR